MRQPVETPHTRDTRDTFRAAGGGVAKDFLGRATLCPHLHRRARPARFAVRGGGGRELDGGTFGTGGGVELCYFRSFDNK